MMNYNVRVHHDRKGNRLFPLFLPFSFSGERRASVPSRFDAQHPMARHIGVELCRIADEIEAQFVREEETGRLRTSYSTLCVIFGRFWFE